MAVTVIEEMLLSSEGRLFSLSSLRYTLTSSVVIGIDVVGSLAPEPGRARLSAMLLSCLTSLTVSV